MEKIPANDYHVPVLYHETLDALSIVPDGIYVDCTFGGVVIAEAFWKNWGPRAS